MTDESLPEIYEQVDAALEKIEEEIDGVRTSSDDVKLDHMHVGTRKAKACVTLAIDVEDVEEDDDV